MLHQLLGDFAADLRLAVRALRKRPAFALSAIAVIALGVGASTTIFTGAYAVLLRPLPFASPDEIVVAWGERRASDRPQIELSWPEFRDWARESRSFESVAALPYASLGVTLGGPGEPARIDAIPVTEDFFRVLGASAQLGRTFARGEAAPGAAPLVILSEGLWRQRFGADSAILGRAVPLDGTSYTVIGVMPAEFDFPRDTEAWLTLGSAVPYAAEDRSLGFLLMVGRLREGISSELARDELSAVVRRLAVESSLPEPADGAVLSPLSEYVLGASRPASLLLLAAAALLLVLAMANVAGLLLTRATARQHEMAVRMALGARRDRLARQLLAESLALAIAGGAAGVLIARPMIAALQALVPDSVPRADEIALNGAALGMAAALTLCVAVGAGLLPAFRAIPARGVHVLRAGTRGTADRGGRRALDALIISQVALTLALLLGAGLIGRSVLALERVRLGFDPGEVVSAQVSLPENAYPDLVQQRAFMAELVDRVSELPNVLSAAAVLVRPLEGPYGFTFPFRAEGQDSASAAANPMLTYQSVTPGYFATMRIPMLGGRDFSERDREESAGVAIIGESLARRIWPGEHAVGKRLRVPNARRPRGEWLEIVGVVEDVRSRELHATSFDIYIPMEQSQFAPQFLVARTRGGALAAVPVIRARLAAMDPSVPLARIATMEQRRDAMLAAPRFGAVLLGGFALAALILAIVGLYGVLAYAVSQRTREIGIRVALGARPVDVRKVVTHHAGRLVATGAAVGLVPAALGALALERFLYGVEALDARTFAAIAIVLGMAAVIASWLPARRAARVDPVTAMRSDV